MGMATSVKLLAMHREPPTAEEARLLELDGETLILRCRRLRLVEGQPYCYNPEHPAARHR